MRPADKARRPSILGICKGGATPPAGMPRPAHRQVLRGTGHYVRPFALERCAQDDRRYERGFGDRFARGGFNGGERIPDYATSGTDRGPPVARPMAAPVARRATASAGSVHRRVRACWRCGSAPTCGHAYQADPDAPRHRWPGARDGIGGSVSHLAQRVDVLAIKVTVGLLPHLSPGDGCVEYRLHRVDRSHRSHPAVHGATSRHRAGDTPRGTPSWNHTCGRSEVSAYMDIAVAHGFRSGGPPVRAIPNKPRPS